jgi:microcystin-dependent protein
MDILNKKSRADLQAYFKKNSIPTEGNFKDLIGSALNQRDDGIVKPPGDPLSVEASDQTHKPVLSLYEAFTDSSASWVISLATPGGSRGFSVNHGSTTPSASDARLFIEAATGDVGIGTVEPTHTLTVAGSLAAESAEIAGALRVPSIAPLSSAASADLGIAAGGGGTVNVTSPLKVTATLDVAGNLKAGSLSLGGTSATKIVTTMASGDSTSLPTATAVQTYVDEAIPDGVILMWNGIVPPKGWLLCNGDNGTPNLKDRFVLGHGDTYKQSNTGGSSTVPLEEKHLPRHTHNVTLTMKVRQGVVNQAGAAEWGIQRNDVADKSRDGSKVYSTTPTTTGDSITVSAFGSTSPDGKAAAHENMPPYYVLAFIMRKRSA